MRLELNMVGVEALREFAGKMEQVCGSYAESVEELYGSCGQEMDGLGVRREQFVQMLNEIGASVNRFAEAVEVLTPKMRACADAIEVFIHQTDSSEDAPRSMGTRVRTPYGSGRGRTESYTGDTVGFGGSPVRLFGRRQVEPADFERPRALAQSMQRMITRPDGGMTYNSPAETGKHLDYRQGKMKGYGGTCGLCSCENILRLAGVHISEEDIVQYAADNGLCATGGQEDENGGTNYENRKILLEAFGVQSSLQQQNVYSIAQAVMEGKGVIISVDAGKLWNDARYLNGLHAVTVTSVDRDAAGRIESFHICDSGFGEYDMIVSAENLQRALAENRKMNVTQQIIR